MDKLLIKRIKQHLTDVTDLNGQAWCEGYISALADHNVINESEFEDIESWIIEKCTW